MKLKIERYPHKADWWLLLEGAIVRAAGSLAHCRIYKRLIEHRKAQP